MTTYIHLLEYCESTLQTKYIEALIQAGNNAAAARILGTTRQSVQKAVKRITKQAQKRGLLEAHKDLGTVPEGFYAETSVKRRLNPQTNVMEVVEDWTKSRLDKSLQAELYKSFIEGLGQEIIPAKPVKLAKQKYNSELASAIIFGDAHIGMLAHAIETLDRDVSLESATGDLRAAIDYCVSCALPSEEGWFINVGDFLHACGTKNTTHGNTPLDVSANHNQVMRAAGSVIRYCIDQMLTKFKHITVVNARGNHDEDAAFALNMYLEGIYEKEIRVTVQGNDSRFNFIEFGKCLIGINHGDSVNAHRLCGVMTRLQPEAWGRTTYRRWWLGHIHHKVTQEHESGIILESFPTLAPIDKWHANSGYGAESRVTVITLHRKHGEVMRIAPSLDLIRENANLK